MGASGTASGDAFSYPDEDRNYSTILIIECQPRVGNRVLTAFKNAREEDPFFRANYKFKYFRWSAGAWDASKSLAELGRWMRLEPKSDFSKQEEVTESPVSLDRQEEIDALSGQLSRLKAVIIGVDTGTSSHDIIREVRFYYPNMPIFVISYQPSEGDCDLQVKLCDYVRKEVLGGAPLVCRADDMLGLEAHNLLAKIRAIHERQQETPYWNALREYAERNPVVSFHALPLGSRRSTSPSIEDFIAFYGQKVLSIETSLAAGPLDSLLEPKTSLRSALDRAAIAFGAKPGVSPDADINLLAGGQGTRFVTNGTSTANRIVLTACVKPNDVVLIDRNCHISHHYALAYCYARPVYMEPFQNQYRISGPVSLHTLQVSFKQVLEKRKLPAAIVLTNPTFDGIFYRPEKVVQAVATALAEEWMKKDQACAKFAGIVEYIDNYLRSAGHDHWSEATREALCRCKDLFVRAAMDCIVFLFDEAWAACAYFHPRLIEFTAMKAALLLKQGKSGNIREHNLDPNIAHARIYATQSTHKSLSALRQGSMIHYSDHLMTQKSGRVSANFDQSFKAHTTTSASASILASLDVARRQAQAEGTELVERSFFLAERFRKAFTKESGSELYAVTPSEMLRGDRDRLSNDDFFADPTRVTITSRRCISGKELRNHLLKSDMQVNKYDNRSVLAIFNIGVNSTSVTTLVRTLRNLAHELKGANTAATKPNPELPPFDSNLGKKSLGDWLMNQEGHKETRIIVSRSHVRLDDKSKSHVRVDDDSESFVYVSAGFIAPYPPGFPVLVPGQRIREADLSYLRQLDNEEIHGTVVNKDKEIEIRVLKAPSDIYRSADEA